MSRLGVTALESPHPLHERLPAMLQEDDFATRLTSALDVVLAPVFATLDCREAYFDPKLTPEDFLPWLAGWLGIAVDERWSSGHLRRVVSQTPELQRWRGTRRGLAALVELHTGVTPDIDEGGAVIAASAPGTAVPGRSGAPVAVRVAVADPSAVDAAALTALVREAVPAHLACTVEVVQQ